MKHSREQPVCGGLQPRQKRVYLCTLGAATFVVWGKAGNVANSISFMFTRAPFAHTIARGVRCRANPTSRWAAMEV